MAEYVPSLKYQQMQHRKKMRRRHRRLQLLCLLILLIILTAIILLVMYLFKAPLFDRSGWYTDKSSAISYRDYYGKPYTQWQTIDGEEYYFDPETGIMATGLVEIDGTTYYFDENGHLSSGWVSFEEERYYLTENSTPYTGWLEQDNDLYYFNEDGTMATGAVEIDGVTRHFASTGKYVVVVNRWNAVPEDYVLDLTEVEGFEVAAICSEALLQMMLDCREAGHVCVLNSTYRSVEVQQWLWDNRYYMNIDEGYSPEESYERTVEIVAYPGTSEHHLGLAVDIIGTDSMYEWLANNSWKYGFILRYPGDKSDYTGIIYEPWHFRYVGTELAEELYHSGLCLEEYMEMLTD